MVTARDEGRNGVPGRDGGAARVLLFSQRTHNHAVWQATQYEFEDVVAEVDDVHLLAPGRDVEGQVAATGRKMLNRARRSVGLPRTTSLHKADVEGRYDLFFAVFHHARDIPHLSQVQGWRERCDKAVAFVIELWPPKIPAARDLIRELRHFDHVFVFSRGSIPAIQEITGVPTTYLPTATDTLRFSPRPDETSRCIDVYTYGRRLEDTHAALVRAAEDRRLTYVFDTVRGPLAFADHREHRLVCASMLRRSRFSVVYKMNDDPGRAQRTGGEEALTTRYFEAAAAGTVVLGTVPDTEDFTRCFDWPGAIVEIPHRAYDIADTIAALDADPARLALVRRRSVAESLRRHDWVHRWAEVLDVVGLAHTDAMRERQLRLNALAALSEETMPG